jgi:hypothetical protein
MDLLQYSFTLDPSHPMEAVRERVVAKRHLIDGLHGLRWKAWMISEPLAGRDQPKTYAPLYLFDNTQATVAFLRGSIYKGVIDAFGWTSPLHGHVEEGALCALGGARSCAVHTTNMRDHQSLQAARGALAPADDAILVARLLDVSRMVLRRYTFRAVVPSAVEDADAELVYEVVSVSYPPERR